MINKQLVRVALRYKAIYLGIERNDIDMSSSVSVPVMAFTERLRENGFCVTEELLHALNAVSANELSLITKCINNVMETNLNWASLVKGWDIPTGETRADHLVTFLANILGEKFGFKGTTLPCGHLIPEGTFPLERYNGCPFCGTPFKTADFVYKGQGSKLKELRLFTDKDMTDVLVSLLTSATPLDETQKDSLTLLLDIYDMPDVEISMKETAMIATKYLVEKGKAEEAQKIFKSPTDVLRYLWYEKTGLVQIIEPKTLIAHAAKLNGDMWGVQQMLAWSTNREAMDAEAKGLMKSKLMLKYDRKACLRVAKWLNNLPMSTHAVMECMNPKRGMWVRMIHALRLGEYSRKKGFEHLKEILDVFYKQSYKTWQGKVDAARKRNDAITVFSLLKQRPGLFARCLFATMLRFGKEDTLKAFEEIAENVPARLLLSLGNAAETYFTPNAARIARPLTGGTHPLSSNPMTALYSEAELKDMQKSVDNLYRSSMKRRFKKVHNENKTIYIDPMLHDIPISVGDRSTTIQDTSCALMGTKFHVEGDAVRLFLQWGKGLHAQHLDMDLSCRISYADGTSEDCAYYNLTCTGARHSGDIQHIPEMVGTAEYIELSLPKLEAAGAQYVTFTCNAYTMGSLSPNLVVGWMDSANPMKVSDKTGVAYDPSCVQHMVRISESNLAKGLVFGVLDVKAREIIWLEMPFTAQTLRGANQTSIEALLKRLRDKMTIGELLLMKADGQGLEIVDNVCDADESYTYECALNPAEVSKLLYI